MKRNNIFFKVFNEESILIQWNDKVDINLIDSIISYKNLIEQELSEILIECVQSINSMMVIYNSNKINSEDLINTLENLYSLDLKVGETEKKIWKIPVCYDLSFGIDLEDLSTSNSISIDEIIKLHNSLTYNVLSIGFLPGFLYLGMNDKKLYCERKDKPKLNIKSGSVGIARDQTGIYPQDSPGGWRIIGRSPISFFNVDDKSPCFAKPGDKIKFQNISLSEFNQIEINKSSYKIKYEVI
jgi:KipI family sensor histidine kinase inhibitor